MIFVDDVVVRDCIILEIHLLLLVSSYLSPLYLPPLRFASYENHQQWQIIMFLEQDIRVDP